MNATAEGCVTKTPIGSGFLLASRGTFPQIHVVSPPGLMKLRPKDAPNEPGAGNRGTPAGRVLISCLFFAKVGRSVRSTSRVCTAAAVKPASTPLLDSAPRLMCRFVIPSDGIVV